MFQRIHPPPGFVRKSKVKMEKLWVAIIILSVVVLVVLYLWK